MIPLGRPSITADDLEAVTAALTSGRLTQGTQVAAFEAELAELVGVGHAVVVSSGTAALAVSLAALGVGRGDRVIVPAYSWVATANVVELAGATPVFVDIDPDTFGIDPPYLATVIEGLAEQDQLASVRAILPVHVFGYVAEMEEIVAMGDSAGIPVIEDAACALGASLSGRPAGSIGAAGCFSFHPLKVVTTGEGGAITTDDPDFAEFARTYRNHGQSLAGGERTFEMAGPNLRMTDFQAALGRSQLARLGSMLDERHDLFERYHVLLSGLPLRCQSYDRTRTTGQVFTVLLNQPEVRPDVLTLLRDFGIEAATGTIAMPFTRHFSRRYHLSESDLPVTAAVDRSAVSLPLYNGMTHQEQDLVVTALEKALDGSS